MHIIPATVEKRPLVYRQRLANDLVIPTGEQSSARVTIKAIWNVFNEFTGGALYSDKADLNLDKISHFNFEIGWLLYCFVDKFKLRSDEPYWSVIFFYKWYGKWLKRVRQEHPNFCFQYSNICWIWICFSIFWIGILLKKAADLRLYRRLYYSKITQNS